MLIYESTETIAAAPARIWRVLADVERWHEWTRTITRIESLDLSPLRVGARYKVFQARLRPATWVVTDARPSEGFSWVATNPGLRVSAQHLIQRRTGNESRVVLRVAFSGLLAAIVGRLSRRLTEDYLAEEAASLKRRIEALS
jgi:hypothetical protein